MFGWKEHKRSRLEQTDIVYSDYGGPVHEWECMGCGEKGLAYPFEKTQHECDPFARRRRLDRLS